MAFRSDITIDWIGDAGIRLIDVAAPSTTVTCQDLYDTCRFWEAFMTSTDNQRLVDAGGKDDLGGGRAVGITLRLINAQVQFEPRGGPTYTQTFVTDGNIVAVAADEVSSISPIYPSAFTQAVIQQSTSPSIINAGADALWDTEIENGRSAAEMWRLLHSALVGVIDGANTNTMTFYSDDGLKVRLEVNVDAFGNRTGFTIKDGSP